MGTGVTVDTDVKVGIGSGVMVLITVGSGVSVGNSVEVTGAAQVSIKPSMDRNTLTRNNPHLLGGFVQKAFRLP